MSFFAAADLLQSEVIAASLDINARGLNIVWLVDFIWYTTVAHERESKCADNKVGGGVCDDWAN
jgi:hypothetical protein